MDRYEQWITNKTASKRRQRTTLAVYWEKYILYRLFGNDPTKAHDKAMDYALVHGIYGSVKDNEKPNKTNEAIQ